MAGASMKDIKSRIKSMHSTRQITKAMEMVAASKLRSAQSRAIASRPYFETLYETMHDIADATKDFVSPYLQIRDGKTLFIVIAGDRGLAGGYNSSVLKLAYSQMDAETAAVLPIGRKAVDFFRQRGVSLLSEQYAEAADVSIGECCSISRLLCSKFLSGEFASIRLAYTNFASLLSQTPAVLQMLPLRLCPQKTASGKFTLYDSGPESVFHTIVPEYLAGLLYGALCESIASEHAARRMAMDAATKNADEMIGDLSLQYNRARQGAITQEITQIIAGAEHT